MISWNHKRIASSFVLKVLFFYALVTFFGEPIRNKREDANCYSLWRRVCWGGYRASCPPRCRRRRGRGGRGRGCGEWWRRSLGLVAWCGNGSPCPCHALHTSTTLGYTQGEGRTEASFMYKLKRNIRRRWYKTQGRELTWEGVLVLTRLGVPDEEGAVVVEGVQQVALTLPSLHVTEIPPEGVDAGGGNM